MCRMRSNLIHSFLLLCYGMLPSNSPPPSVSLMWRARIGGPCRWLCPEKLIDGRCVGRRACIMAPKVDSVEGTILGYINEQNRPLNAQMVADALQKNGIKKTAVQKVMDTLASNGKISFKNYGKQRVCMANQSQFEIPNIDELDVMKKQNVQLLADVAAVRSHVSDLEAGVKSSESSLTLDAIWERTKKIGSKIEVMESKVEALREGSVLVTPEERLEVQGAYDLKLGLWRRRRKIYQEMWGMITESMTEDLKDLKEEIGIETDEDVGCNVTDYSNFRVKRQSNGF